MPISICLFLSFSSLRSLRMASSRFETLSSTYKMMKPVQIFPNDQQNTKFSHTINLIKPAVNNNRRPHSRENFHKKIQGSQLYKTLNGRLWLSEIYCQAKQYVLLLQCVFTSTKHPSTSHPKGLMLKEQKTSIRYKQ